MVKLKDLVKSSKAAKAEKELVVEEVKEDKLPEVLEAIDAFANTFLSEWNLREALGKITVKQNELLEYHLQRLNHQLLNKQECKAIVSSVLR